MPSPVRLFVAAPLAEGVEVAASAAQARYLGAVMRRGPGEAVRLFNGRDGEWSARIARLDRDRATFAVETMLRAQAGGADLWLAFALLKRDATDLVVRQATELGAAAILPVLTERTVAARVNADRLEAIATEAAEQCERLDLPAIHAPVPLPALLDGWPAGRTLFVAAERAGAPWPDAAAGEGSGPAALLVGPEGGFSPGEHALLRRQPFARLVGLGATILRAETAAVAGLALLQCRAVG
jgi:16S rRNA (uracil1498-N3)-methyltransferase